MARCVNRVHGGREGAETQLRLEYPRKYSCNLQGYFFNKSLPVYELERALKNVVDLY